MSHISELVRSPGASLALNHGPCPKEKQPVGNTSGEPQFTVKH